MAIALVSTPKPNAERPIGPGSTAYSTKTANTADEARFITPTINASVRNRRWWNR